MGRFQKFVIGTALVTFLALVCAMGLFAMREAERAARDSAHAALTDEICHQLAAVPQGQRYPDSLSELRLTYPDGGDASLLSLFEYRSTGTNCTLRTRLAGREILRSFP